MAGASRPVIDAIHERFDLLAYARQYFPGEQQRTGTRCASPATAACCSNRKPGSGSAIGKPSAATGWTWWATASTASSGNVRTRRCSGRRLAAARSVRRRAPGPRQRPRPRRAAAGAVARRAPGPEPDGGVILAARGNGHQAVGAAQTATRHAGPAPLTLSQPQAIPRASRSWRPPCRRAQGRQTKLTRRPRWLPTARSCRRQLAPMSCALHTAQDHHSQPRGSTGRGRSATR